MKLLYTIRKKLKHLLRKRKNENIDFLWIKNEPNSWLSTNIEKCLACDFTNDIFDKIERRAIASEKLGLQPLWSGYQKDKKAKKKEYRSSDDVRTSPTMGAFYSCLINTYKPSVLIEIGTAFGVSGMYWLAGLEKNNKGELITFDPNDIWAKIAKTNLSFISEKRFTLVNGTFEDNIHTYIDTKTIDITFIDAIHTSEFVFEQYKLALEKSHSGSLIILDDIQISNDMEYAWTTLANSPQIKSSLKISNRVGILEVA